MSDCYCNICGSRNFKDFNGRKQVMCAECESLERHRLVKWTLEKYGYLEDGKFCRVLHLAPEAASYRYLLAHFGASYLCSDKTPEYFPHAKCLRLSLPDGFNTFPDCYFQLILHNHVLEHIPGDFKEHLIAFDRILDTEGKMIFTIPLVNNNSETIQGGENLSQSERIKLHGQFDHYKTFGKDFFKVLNYLPGKFSIVNISDEIRKQLHAPGEKVYLYEKRQSLLSG